MSNGPSKKALALVEGARIARELQEAIGPLLQKRLDSVDKRVYAAITENGSLAADVAVQAWIEKKALRDLLLSIERQLDRARGVESEFSLRDNI